MANDSFVGQTLGKYTITDLLGRGGMAEVYKGYREDLDRTVAIKLMHAFLAAEEDFLARFKREARAMAQLRHPNIVTIHDFDVYEGDTYYLVMEFISGGTLKDLLMKLAADGKRLPLHQSVRITLEITDALSYAHELDMVHRDIKPGNIMLDKNGRPVLTDFGIVKLLGGQSMAFTATGALIGTPAYMSPEQALGKPGDARSDIYSLGILLFQMLTGQVPFEADTPLAVVLKHVNDAPRPPLELNPDLPHDLQEIVLKAIDKNPDDRFQTAAELAAALRAVRLETGPVQRTIAAAKKPEPARPEAAPEATQVKQPEATRIEVTPPEPDADREAEATQEEPEPLLTRLEPAASSRPTADVEATQVEPEGSMAAAEQAEPPQESYWLAGAPPPASMVVEEAATAVRPAAARAQQKPVEPAARKSAPRRAATARSDPPWLIIGGAIGVVIMIAAAFIIFGGSGGEDEVASPTATSAVAVVIAPTDTSEPPTPTATAPPTATATEAPPSPTPTTAPSATPLPTATPIPIPEGMVFIPGATFEMGSSDGRADEGPLHTVSLSAYYLDQFEVSNAQYQACVADGACTQVRSGSFTRGDYRDNPEFANYPAIGVNWNQATAYCQWAGKRLPTEAEWEYAAGGPEKLTWPWGNEFDVGLSAAGSRDTQPVDSFPDGRSPFEVYNMAGNVGEWVQDNYSATFYGESAGAEDPVAELGGNMRVFRGGSFANTNGDFYRVARRFSQSVTYSDVDIGLRCAQESPGEVAIQP